MYEHPFFKIVKDMILDRQPDAIEIYHDTDGFVYLYFEENEKEPRTQFAFASGTPTRQALELVRDLPTGVYSLLS